MRTLFVINPISGKGRSPERLIKRIRKIYGRNSGPYFETRIWDRPDRINEIVKYAQTKKFDAIVAFGGDGTAQAIGSRLVNTDVAFGIIPTGSGNGFARNLGFSMKPKRALKQMLTAQRKTIDTGTFGEKPFINAAGIGVDAETVYRYSRAKGRGLRTYIKAAIPSFLRYKPYTAILVVDGKEHTIPNVLTLNIANGVQWGSGAKIAPTAQMDDGMFEAVILQKTNVTRLPKLFNKLFRGTLDTSSQIMTMKGKHFVIIRPKPGRAHVDGEAIRLGKNIECIVNEKSVDVLVPAPKKVV